MKHRILLPTDFSDNSWSAIVYALKLFKDEFCTFYFLNSIAINASTMSNLSNKLLKKIEEDAMIELLALKELAETSDANILHNFQIILSPKDLRSAVNKAVTKWNIDLVIMGTKGAKGSKKLFFGSNTIHVLKSLKHCPVLIIPEEYDFITPTQIAFPTDYNRFYDLKELNPLLQLALLHNSKIRIVHLNFDEELSDIQDFNFTVLKSYLINYEYSLHWMPKYAKKETEINDFIEELGINILVMIKYKHSIIDKIINEPVIEKIGYHPIVPFLVIPE